MADIFSELKNLRRKLAERDGVELFMVFSNKTLEELCEKLPKNTEELLEIKGMGEKKAAKFGRAILAVVNQGLEAASEEARTSSSRTGLAEVVEPGNDMYESVDTSTKQNVTVSQYVDYLNLVLQKTADVKILGEVSGAKMYPSGFYFTLKDKLDESALSCYLPIYTYKGLGIPIEDGMEVAVEGAPRLIKRNGRFQFIVENLHLVGEGALKKAYDFLKAKLEEEGLFARKRALPEFISSVGVITSRAGAVIHDFRNNLAKRGIKVYLKDVRVEGASSPGMVTNAIKWFNKQATPVDVLVLMRGGGSLEDLQGFNNEQVVRAVFGSHIPTIVSIGHDKDVPLAQLAADVMVSTPTAAAHAVASTWDNLVHAVPRMQGDLLYYADMQMQEARSIFALNVQSLFSWCGRIAQSYKVACDGLAVYIIRYMEWLNTQRQSVAGFAIRIAQTQGNAQVYTLKRVDAVEAFLEQVNPERQLKLGYSIVKDGSGKLVRSIVDVGPGESLETQVVDGIIHSIVQ